MSTAMLPGSPWTTERMGTVCRQRMRSVGGSTELLGENAATSVLACVACGTVPTNGGRLLDTVSSSTCDQSSCVCR